MNLSQALKSKTVLFGLLLTIASVVQILIPYMPPEFVGPVGTAAGLAVIVLRFLTSVPLELK